MIETEISISGVKRADIESTKVVTAIGEAKTSSSFESSFNNWDGRLSGTFTIGDEVNIRAEWNPGCLRVTNGSPPTSDDMGSFVLYANPYTNNIGEPYPYKTDQSFTISFWLMGSWEDQNNISQHRLFEKRNTVATSVYPILSQIRANRSIDFLMVGTGGPANVVTGSATIPNGSWIHVTYLRLNDFNGGVGSNYIYLDGSLAGSNASALTATDNQDHFKFGGWDGFSGAQTTYWFDDFRIYHTGLTVDAIRAVREGRYVLREDNPRYPHLMAHFPFNERSGSVASSRVPVVNNGSISPSLASFEKDYPVPIPSIFRGRVEDIEFSGKANQERLRIMGRDFSSVLQDSTIEPEVYTNLKAGSIVKDIVNKYAPGMTAGNVQEGSVVIDRIVFNQTNVYEGIKKLAELVDFNFWVDDNKDVHFEHKSFLDAVPPVEIMTSGIGSVRPLSSVTKEHDDRIYNRVWVYGDRYLAGEKEIINADGGSVFTLLNNPNNTEIETSNDPGSILKGGIFGLTVEPLSGPNYLVNFQDKQIVFQSGTNLGYDSIPTSGGSIIAVYDKELPIVKFGEDRSSIDKYGQRTKVIIDKGIKDSSSAVDIMKATIEKHREPIKEATINLRGLIHTNPGERISIDIDKHSVSGVNFEIKEKRYNINPITVRNDNIMTIKTNESFDDITDILRDLLIKERLAQSQDMKDTDLITRSEFTIGSYNIVGSIWKVSTTSDLGSSFILGKGPHGVTGITFGGILGSVPASGLNFLGDSRDDFVVQASGGFYF